MKLSEQQKNDLGRLGLTRCEQSLQSVTQLMDGPDAYQLAIAVACCIIEGAADMLQQGTKSNERDAKNHVIGDVLTGLGVTWKCKNSRTQSARK
jgi:hypothetical protein